MRFLALCLLLAELASTGLAGKDRYEKWIGQEVKWIASHKEIAAFKALASETDKEAFMLRFWKRRDPTPATARNEYKEEYYRRWKYVNSRFREGVPGWRSDRGRVYLVHGPPDQIQHVTADRVTEQDSIIWTYFALPTAYYSKGRILVVFQPNIGLTRQDVTLGESTTGRQQAQRILGRAGLKMSDIVRHASRYRLVAAGPPAAVNSRGVDVPLSGIGEFARYVEDIFRSPGDILEKSQAEDQRRWASREALRQQVTSSVTFGTLPVSMSCQDFYQQGEARVTVSWQVPLDALEFRKSGGVYSAKVDLVARLTELPSGTPVDEFFKTIDLDYSSAEFQSLKGQDFRYLNEFAVEPGDYQVRSVVKDVNSGTLGTDSQEIHCRSLRKGEIALSGLVLSQTLSDADPSGLGSELRVGQWQVIPESDRTFSRQDKLVLFFHVYNSEVSAEGVPQVVVNYDFFSHNQLVKTSGPRELTEFTDTADRSIAFSSIVDLTSFEPGDYLVQVNAIDFKTRKYAIERANFVIE
ncbi:MAG: GWxTD domain-containing protein [Acidobacteriota bacterium]